MNVLRFNLWEKTKMLLGLLVITLSITSQAIAEPCNDESIPGFGLCKAYCESMNCGTESQRASDAACEKVRANYERITGNSQVPCGAPAYDRETETKLSRTLSENTLDVRFIVIGDPHFQWDYDWSHLNPHLQNQEKLEWIVDDINSTCKWLAEHGPACSGIVLVGDMIRGEDFNESLTEYRYRYDNGFNATYDDFDYPYYGSTIKYQVFPNIGNHDDYSEWRLNDDVGEHDAHLPVQHVMERVMDSEALFQGVDGNGDPISNYHFSDYGPNYAWEWGNFHFIHLGMWAFYGGFSNSNGSTRSTVDQPKIAWLQDHLKAIGKEKPIILFQHFGWDEMSMGDKNSGGGSEWWTTDNVDMLADVLCDRPISVGNTNETCDDGYNIVGIFSGHTHQFGFVEAICATGEYDKANSTWNCSQKLLINNNHINNYIVDDAGREDTSGFFNVHLTLDAQGNGTMEVEKVMLTDWEDGTILEDGKYKRSVGDYPAMNFTSMQVFRFDQGQPDNAGENHGGSEDCAVIKANGRYNDFECSEPRHLLCKDSGDKWHLSASDEYTWNDGFLHCQHYGQAFTEPKSLADQTEIMDLFRENNVAEAWINYNDLLKEGDWREGPSYLAYFGNGEPNNGEDRFERGWGQNCAAIMRDGTVHDFSCEEALDHFLCYYEADWFVGTKSPGDWKAGNGVCASYAGRDSDLDELDVVSLMVKRAKEYFQDNPDVSAMWVPLNDLDKEGAWKDDVPWIVHNNQIDRNPGDWIEGQPDGGTSQNCAIMVDDGWDIGWHDAECEQSSDAWPFACRNYETGDWMITTKASKNWIDGFEYCRTEHADEPYGFQWHFATPIRESANETLQELMDDKVARVWLNYTDAPSDSGEDMEGFWRHGYWKKWGTNEPDPSTGDEQNCGGIALDTTDGNFWFDEDCSVTVYRDLDMKLTCRSFGELHPGEWILELGESWDQCSELCKKIEYGRFTYPTCPSEFEAMHQAASPLEGGFWIPFHDTYHEGYFTPR